jgi:GNAT superfamily N-acetyltransferase
MAPFQSPEAKKPESFLKRYTAKALGLVRGAFDGGQNTKQPVAAADDKAFRKSFADTESTARSYSTNNFDQGTEPNDHEEPAVNTSVEQTQGSHAPPDIVESVNTSAEQTQSPLVPRNLIESASAWSEETNKALQIEPAVTTSTGDFYQDNLRKQQKELSFADKLAIHAENRRLSRSSTLVPIAETEPAESPSPWLPEEEDFESDDPQATFEGAYENGALITELLPIGETDPEPGRPLDLYHIHLRRGSSQSIRPSHKRTHSYVVDDELAEAPYKRASIAKMLYDAMRASVIGKLFEEDVFGLGVFQQDLDCPLKLQLVPSGSELKAEDITNCLALIELTSGQDYAKSSMGWNAKKKKEELQDKDMMFLLIRADDFTSRILGFMSFMFTNDDPPKQDREVVYLYEVHLLEFLRGRGLGGKLLAFLEEAARLCGVTKTMLTVFVANEGARRMYEKAGYVKDSCSPAGRKVRKRVIEADYLIMSKELA